MIPKPKSELTVIFISITIIMISLAVFGYYYLTKNQTALMNQFENQRVIRADIVNVILNNISGTLQANNDKLVKVMEALNITDDDQ